MSATSTSGSSGACPPCAPRPPSSPLSPWGKAPPSQAAQTAPAPAPTLEDIMSEQLAELLHEKYTGVREDREIAANICGDCDDDHAIAAALQEQYDREYRDRNRRYGMEKNGLYKYKCAPQDDHQDHLELFPDGDDDMETRVWKAAAGTEARDQLAGLPKKGAALREGKLVTKHDALLSSRVNGSKLMNLPHRVDTGDAALEEVRLTGKVLGELREHARRDRRREHRRLDRKEAARTAAIGMDERTRMILYKMVNGGLLASVGGAIATGKEAVVLSAKGDRGREGEEPPPECCAVKVFKTTLDEFKGRHEYVEGDRRFGVELGKPNARKMIRMWAEKEMRNLRRMGEAGLPCPRVVRLDRHVLVMEMIGRDGRPAPQLREVRSTDDWPRRAWSQVKEGMLTMYREAKLVHADLSEYNILWNSGRCWFIDVSQAVTLEHPSAMRFLLRDCGNVVRFFDARGVDDLPTAEELFEEITGIRGEELDTHRKLWASGSEEYAFDFAWDESFKIDDENDSESDEE